MPDNKEIRFSFVVDEPSAEKMKRIISDLTNSAQALQKALGGQGAGGPGLLSGGIGNKSQGTMISNAQAPAGRQTITSVFEANAQGLKKLADISTASMRTISDVINRGSDEQVRHLTNLDKMLERLQQRYQNMNASAGHFGGAAGVAAASLNTPPPLPRGIFRPLGRSGIGGLDLPGSGMDWDDENVRRLHHEQARNNISGIPDFQNPPPAPPGFWARAGGWASSPMGGAGGALRAAGMAGMGAQMIASEAVAGLSTDAVQNARRAGMIDPQIRRLLGGDIKTLFALQTMTGSQRDDLKALVQPLKTGAIDGRVMGQLGMTWNQATEIVGQGVGSIPLLGGLARTGGVIGADRGGGMLGAATTTNIQSNRAESMLHQAELTSKALVMENIALDQFNQELGSRAHAQRTLGLGLGLGKDGTYNDAFGHMQNRLTAQGYDISQYGAATVGMRNQAGSRAGNLYGFSAMAAQAEGLGGYDSMLAASLRAGAGSDAFARGAMGGDIDRYAGVQLGAAIQGQGFNPRGTTSGYGTLAMAQTGGFGFSGDSSDFQKVGQLTQGMKLLDSLTTGSLDPYQGARNLVGAINAHPNASVYAQDFLANGMDSKQMMDMMRGGELTATAEGYGFDKDDITRQFGESVSSKLDTWYDDNISSDPISKAMRGFESSGQNLPDYLKGISDPTEKRNAERNIGALYGQLSGMGEEGGIGALALLGGDPTAAITKGGVGRGLSGSNAVAFESMAASAERVTAALEQNAKRMEDAYKTAPGAVDTFAKFNDRVTESADKFTTALLKMVDALNNARTRMSGGNTWHAGAK